jgi:hypothetical protein
MFTEEQLAMEANTNLIRFPQRKIQYFQNYLSCSRLHEDSARGTAWSKLFNAQKSGLTYDGPRLKGDWRKESQFIEAKIRQNALSTRIGIQELSLGK